jgi:hypothetical protein
VLELTPSAVETLIFRARRALREQLEASLTCGDAELAISRQLDGRLSRKDRGALRAHLRECKECATAARRQRAQRNALKSLATVPVPTSLTSLFGGGASVGGGLAVKAAAALLTGVVVGGAGYEGLRETVAKPHRHAGVPSAPRRLMQGHASVSPVAAVTRVDVGRRRASPPAPAVPRRHVKRKRAHAVAHRDVYHGDASVAARHVAPKHPPRVVPPPLSHSLPAVARAHPVPARSHRPATPPGIAKPHVAPPPQPPRGPPVAPPGPYEGGPPPDTGNGNAPPAGVGRGK